MNYIIVILCVLLFSNALKADVEFKPLVQKDNEQLLKFQQACEDIQSILNLIEFFSRSFDFATPDSNGGVSLGTFKLSQKKQDLYQKCQLISAVATARTGRDALNVMRMAEKRNDSAFLSQLDLIEKTIDMSEWGDAMSQQWNSGRKDARKNILLNTGNWARLFNYAEDLEIKPKPGRQSQIFYEQAQIARKLNEIQKPFYTGCKITKDSNSDDIDPYLDKNKLERLNSQVTKARRDMVFAYNGISQVEQSIQKMLRKISFDSDYESNIFLVNKLKNNGYDVTISWVAPSNPKVINEFYSFNKRKAEVNEKKQMVGTQSASTQKKCVKTYEVVFDQDGKVQYDSTGKVKLKYNKEDCDGNSSLIQNYAKYSPQESGSFNSCYVNDAQGKGPFELNKNGWFNWVKSNGNMVLSDPLYFNKTFADRLKVCPNSDETILNTRVGTIIDKPGYIEEYLEKRKNEAKKKAEDTCNTKNLDEFKREFNDAVDLRPNKGPSSRYRKGDRNNDTCTVKDDEVKVNKNIYNVNDNQTLRDWIESYNKKFTDYLESVYGVDPSSEKNEKWFNENVENRNNSLLLSISNEDKSRSKWQKYKDRYEASEGITEDQQRVNSEFLEFSLCTIPEELAKRVGEDKVKKVLGSNPDDLSLYLNETDKVIPIEEEKNNLRELEILVAECKFQERDGSRNGTIFKDHVLAMISLQKKYAEALKVIVYADIMLGKYRTIKSESAKQACLADSEVTPLDISIQTGKVMVLVTDLLLQDAERKETEKLEKQKEKEKEEAVLRKAKEEHERMVEKIKYSNMKRTTISPNDHPLSGDTQKALEDKIEVKKENKKGGSGNVRLKKNQVNPVIPSK